MTVPKSGYRGAEKPVGRVALEQPFARANQQSSEARFRTPTRLHDFVRELMDARESELRIERLHQQDADWNVMGSPRWTKAFEGYVTGNDCDTTRDGEWRWPLRSSIFRMSISRSGRDRLAARFVFLLMHNRFHIREAWAQQCGLLADPAIADAAEYVAIGALTRWWSYYLAHPEGKPLA
jgi:hypothetical protein